MYKRHFIYISAGCILFLIFFSPARLYFLSDDFDSILFSLHPAAIFHSFRPLSDASLYVDYSTWKMNATGFHVTNFLLHFLSTFCFYFFARKLFFLRYDVIVSDNMALAASLLFLFYPFHSEALFWIVGRGAVLCTLFDLLCFLFYLQKEKSRLYYWLSLLCFSAALLSYEEAWIIPVIIIFLTVIYKKENKIISIAYASGFWLLFFIYLIGRYSFTQDIIGTPYGSERMLNFNLFLLVKNAAALLFRSVVVPMQSSIAFSITCLLTGVAFATVIFYTRKKINLVFYVSAICFLLTLLPVIPLGIDTHDTESERFLYFPSVFFIICIVQLLHLVFQRRIMLAYTVVFITEIVVLFVSYKSFVISSNICRATISGLMKTVDSDSVFCKDLPTQYKGAFIFRNGFESAVKLVKKDSAQTVVILSKSELYHPADSYKVDFNFLQSGSNSNRKNILIEWKEDKVTFSQINHL